MFINTNTPDQKECYGINYIKMYIGEYLFYCFICIWTIILSLIIPYYLSKCIDIVSNHHGIREISYQVIIFLGIAVMELLSKILVNERNVSLSNKIAFQIEFDTLKHIKYVKYDKIRCYNNAYLTQRINNDAVCIGDYIIEKFTYFITDILTVLILIPLIFRIQFLLGMLILLFIIIYGFLYFFVQKVLYEKNMSMMEAQSNFFAMLDNQLLNILSIKINAWYKESDAEFIKVVTNFFDKSVRFLRVDMSLTAVNTFLNRAAYGCAILLLGFSVARGEATIGTLSIVVIYVQLLLEKIQSLSEFGKCREKYKVAVDRINELLCIDREENGEVVLSGVEQIVTKNLSVMYEKNIFSGKNFLFQKNHIYLICGENGTGKTTFLNSILGVVENAGGSVRYNDMDIKEIDMYAARRELFTVSSQEAILQNATIYDNITYGLKDKPTELESDSVVKALLSFCIKLNKGLNTQVTSQNVALSGGEKQRISLCRVLLKKADVVILDEPTNMLDAEGINDLLELLQKIKRNHIIIIVSHDERVKEIADEILVFEKNNT